MHVNVIGNGEHIHIHSKSYGCVVHPHLADNECIFIVVQVCMCVCVCMFAIIQSHPMSCNVVLLAPSIGVQKHRSEYIYIYMIQYVTRTVLRIEKINVYFLDNWVVCFFALIQTGKLKMKMVCLTSHFFTQYDHEWKQGVYVSRKERILITSRIDSMHGREIWMPWLTSLLNSLTFYRRSRRFFPQKENRW